MPEALQFDEMYCASCGAPIKKEAIICPKCDAQNKHRTSENSQNVPGKALLKITGILLTIFGGLAMLAALLVIGDVLTLDELDLEGFSPLDIFFGALMFLFVGIMGIVYCDALRKAKLLMYIAIACLVLSSIGILIIGFELSDLITISLLIFYLIGAIKNKNAYAYEYEKVHE